MTAPDFAPPIFPELLDSTMIQSFRECPQQFFLAHCRGLRTDGEGGSPDLHFGGCFARAMEVTRLAYFTHGRNANEALAEGIIALTRSWGTYEPREGHRKTYERCVDAFAGYFEQWPLEADPLIPIRYHADTIEYSFAHPLPILHPVSGAPLLYGGRFDMLGTINDEVYIVDEKTTSMGFGTSWAEQWQLRNQFLGYTWAVRRDGVPRAKVLVRGVGIHPTNTAYTQALASYPEHLLDRWIRALLNTVQQMCKCWKLMADEGPEAWPRVFGSPCHAYNRQCAYAPMCLAREPEDYASMYVVHHWSPIPAVVPPSVEPQPTQAVQ